MASDIKLHQPLCFSFLCIVFAFLVFLLASLGAPRGSILGPLLFSVNDLSNASSHFYADDTICCCLCFSVVKTLRFQQFAYYDAQYHLTLHKFLLNADKSKFILFINNQRAETCIQVSLSIRIFSFKLYIENPVSKIKNKLIRFLFRNAFFIVL